MKHNWKALFSQIQEDSRYLDNLDWGKPRRGHPEGTIQAHIAELEQNLEQLQNSFGPEVISKQDVEKLRLLIHVHDTFKPVAKAGVSITHPQSHASLAASFLEESLLCDGEPLDDEASDLVAMVQNHDVGYALWRKSRRQHIDGSSVRFQQLLDAIEDWRLFSAFLIIDNCTAGKTRTPVVWFLELVADFKPEVRTWESCSLLELPEGGDCA